MSTSTFTNARIADELEEEILKMDFSDSFVSRKVVIDLDDKMKKLCDKIDHIHQNIVQIVRNCLAESLLMKKAKDEGLVIGTDEYQKFLTLGRMDASAYEEVTDIRIIVNGLKQPKLQQIQTDKPDQKTIVYNEGVCLIEDMVKSSSDNEQIIVRVTVNSQKYWIDLFSSVFEHLLRVHIQEKMNEYFSPGVYESAIKQLHSNCLMQITKETMIHRSVRSTTIPYTTIQAMKMVQSLRLAQWNHKQLTMNQMKTCQYFFSHRGKETETDSQNTS